MPLIETTYRPGSFPRGAHIETLLPALLRFVRGVRYERERIATADGDFLDLDWAYARSSGVTTEPSARGLVILSHGLEGHSRRPYILGMARAFLGAGRDVLAWNCRGCSGEVNRLPGSYHSGSSDDLGAVVDRVLKDPALERYVDIALVGFSMGGNITMKYLGEQKGRVSKRIKKAVALSVPCDLAGCSVALARRENRLYMANFLTTLRAKAKIKKDMFPETITASLKEIKAIRTFREFDDMFTGPLHGFGDAAGYWQACSGNRFISGIRVPTLLVNARNDTFLNADCFPEAAARKSKYLYLETPERGGHVGFSADTRYGLYWSERRALEWAL